MVLKDKEHVDEDLATYMLGGVWDPLKARDPREATVQNRKGDDASSK